MRGTLGRVIRDVFDEEYLRAFAESVKEMTTGARVPITCKHCGKSGVYMGQVPDIKGQIQAWTELMEQAEGRPGTDSAEQQGTTIVVERPPR